MAIRGQEVSAVLLTQIVGIIKIDQSIGRHLDGSLIIRTYHGKNRCREISTISDSDVVLTTYHTVATEYAAAPAGERSILHQVGWFRIVLDEGTRMRNSHLSSRLDSSDNTASPHHPSKHNNILSNSFEARRKIPLVSDWYSNSEQTRRHWESIFFRPSKAIPENRRVSQVYFPPL